MSIFGRPNIDKLERKKDIKRLIKALNYKDNKIRESAANALANIKDPNTVQALKKVTHDKVDSVKKAAKRALNEIEKDQKRIRLEFRQKQESEITQKLLSLSNDERIEASINLLKVQNHESRAIAVSKIADFEIMAVGVWFELANLLGSVHEECRIEAAKAFWKMEGVDYAIRSLRDEYLNPAHMTKQEALRGVYALIITSRDKYAFKDIVSLNWESFPSHELEILRISWVKGESEASKIIMYLAKTADPRVRAAICSEAFRLNLYSAAVWDEVAILLADDNDNVSNLTARSYWKEEKKYKPNQKDPHLRYTPVKLAIGILDRHFKYGRVTRQQAIKGLFSLIDNAPDFNLFDDTSGGMFFDPLAGTYLNPSKEIFKWKEVKAELNKRKEFPNLIDFL